MTETNSRFLRLRSRNPSHARYQAPERAEDYTPGFRDFDSLAATTPGDDIPLDLTAHRPEVES